jgi:hypothetical protein
LCAGLNEILPLARRRYHGNTTHEGWKLPIAQRIRMQQEANEVNANATLTEVIR